MIDALVSFVDAHPLAAFVLCFALLWPDEQLSLIIAAHDIPPWERDL